MSVLRDVQITVDCADVDAQARFWCEVLGYRHEPPPPGFDDWDAALDAWGVPAEQRHTRAAVIPPEGGSGPRMFFQQVPEAKSAKNRLHLDVRAAPGLRDAARMAALQAECDRLVGLGARCVRRFEPGEDAGSSGFIWMEDPEGNEFCLD